MRRVWMVRDEVFAGIAKIPQIETESLLVTGP
jgi:hypothetical protein